MMRTEAGAVARCERVQARKALIENEIMQCEGELRVLMAEVFKGWDGGDVTEILFLPHDPLLVNRKIKAAIVVLLEIQKAEGIHIDKVLQSNIPNFIQALNLIPESLGPTLRANEVQLIHLSFKCLVQSLTEIARRSSVLQSQLQPVIHTLLENIAVNNTDVEHWVQVFNTIGSTLASQDDPNKTIQLVAKMGNSILQEK